MVMKAFLRHAAKWIKLSSYGLTFLAAVQAFPQPSCGQGNAGSLIVLSSELPHDVELADSANPVQEDFDLFSWKSFVALNWPANPNGTPNSSQKIGQSPDAKRVWEFFIHPDDVFLPGGTKPVWKLSGNVGSYLQMSKIPPTFRGESLDALEFPVVDQDKNFVMFDMRLNRDEFDYIVAHQLYSRLGQAGTNPMAENFINFPSGVAGGAVGTIEIKTAWRVFPSQTQSTVKARYFTIDAVLPISAAESVTGNAFDLKVALGLVGFHIIHKTTSRPQWVWSTFEHVDNLSAPPGGKPSFTDPGCTACQANNRPLPPGEPVPSEPDQPTKPPKSKFKWAQTPPFATPNQRIPVQVERVFPIKAQTAQLNTDWQSALRGVDAGSVWQYYQLISTQWPTKPRAQARGVSNSLRRKFHRGRL